MNQERDIRETPLYQEGEALYRSLRQPGMDVISEANSVDVSSDGSLAVFVGTVVGEFKGLPTTRICISELATGETRIISPGANSDRSPTFSPDNEYIAFLSDRNTEGDFQPYLYNVKTDSTQALPEADGWVEYLHWSDDGRHLLLGIAGHGADVAGAAGAATSKRKEMEKLPSWMPSVTTGDESFRWRSVWTYTLGDDCLQQVSRDGLNVWEAVWCGADAIVAIVSLDPNEAAWYTAALHLIDIKSDVDRVLYQPGDQLGALSAAASGKHIAVVEAVCSDRGIVAGELLVINTATEDIQRIDTKKIDISCTQWRSEDRLLVAGHRGFETVIAEYDGLSAVVNETWASQEITTSGIYATVTALGEGIGDCLFVGEGFFCAPEIASVSKGQYTSIVSFDNGYQEIVKACIGDAERVSWHAADGLEIQGLLLRPKGKGPFPLILSVHGGPVWHYRSRWLGRAISTLMMIQRGCAILQSNPRGSSGRGMHFARCVYGDMGGAEIGDHLSGIDYLVQTGIADPARLGVIGGSHGGFITSHIITQEPRFAAAVAILPVTNWVSQHLTSNIAFFDSLVLNGDYNDACSHYFERSPIMYAHKVETPTLHFCGVRDRCTPPGQAQEFHNALLAHGVESVLITYPEEGHGVRQLPTVIDSAARVVAWFEQHMPTTTSL